jgi:hypothetical protein
MEDGLDRWYEVAQFKIAVPGKLIQPRFFKLGI